jgi:hypothetical protein
MQRGIVIGNTSIGYAGLSRLAEMSQLSSLCNEKESYGLPMCQHTIVMVDGCRGLDAGAFTQLRARRNARRRRVGRLVELDASQILIRRPLGILILHERRELVEVL